MSGNIFGYKKQIETIEQEVYEIDNHLHNQEKWLGLAAAPNLEIHRADLMDGTIQPFQLIAGNNDFGAWVQILGSDDTPIRAGMTKADGHRLMVVSTNSTSQHIIQAAPGESADLAAKIAAKEFTMFPYVAATNQNDSGISDIISGRIDSGTKAWWRVACVGQNATTLDFYLGIHEYLK